MEIECFNLSLHFSFITTSLNQKIQKVRDLFVRQSPNY